MKEYSFSWLLGVMAFVFTMSGCSSEDDLWADYTSGSNISDNSTSSSIPTDFSEMTGDLSTLTIDIDSTAFNENDTYPTDESDAHYEDYLENNNFTQNVYINYNGSTATCNNVPEGVTVQVNGADVVVSSTVKGVNYILAGSTSDGMFKMATGDDDKKFQLTLNGVTIHNNDGPAINIQTGKRCFVTLAEGTYNILSDGTAYASSSEDQKATFFSEGELLFNGSGKLRIFANAKNGIASDDYILFRPTNDIYIKATSNHAIKSNDGIFIHGGVINVETTATAGKGFNTDGAFEMDGGRVTAITQGDGMYDSDDQDVSAAAGVKADSVIIVNGGTLSCKSTGKGGKGISTDQQLIVNGGIVRVLTTGQTYTYNSRLDSKAKGIKADGNMTVNGGHIIAKAIGGSGSEGIESKGMLTIQDGIVEAYAYDDAINSGSHLYIKGGITCVYATNNDGLDANGNLYIQGGTTMAYGARQPECGIDANEEGGYSIYITGGNLFAIGGGNSTPTSSASTQGYITSSGSFNKNIVSTISYSSTTLGTFFLPYAYSSGSILATANGMTAGNNYVFTIGTTSNTLSAQQYGMGGMGGGIPGGDIGGNTPGGMPGRGR